MNPSLKAILKHAASRFSAGTPARRVTFGRAQRRVALFVMLAAAVPVFGQEGSAGSDTRRNGSIHGTISTTQENAPAGLEGISVKLTGHHLMEPRSPRIRMTPGSTR